MFADKMHLGLLVLLCSYAVATQPAEPPKQSAAKESHKKESVKVVATAESPKKHGEATSNLRKSPTPNSEHKDKEKDPNAVSGLVNGLAALPTKDGKIVPGFAKKANHPAVRALHKQSKPQQNGKSIAKTKPAISAGKPVSEPKPVAKADHTIHASKPVAKAKAMPPKKVSEPKSIETEHHKPVAKAKPASSATKLVAKAKQVVHHPQVTKPKSEKEKQVAKTAAPQRPALVARAYPSLVPMPPKRNSIPTAAVSTSALTEDEQAQKVQHAMEDSERAMQEVDQDVEVAKKEASEAHRIVHAK